MKRLIILLLSAMAIAQEAPKSLDPDLRANTLIAQRNAMRAIAEAQRASKVADDSIKAMNELLSKARAFCGGNLDEEKMGCR